MLLWPWETVDLAYSRPIQFMVWVLLFTQLLGRMFSLLLSKETLESLSLGLLGRLTICSGMVRIFPLLFVSLFSGFGRVPLPLSLKPRIQCRYLIDRSRAPLGCVCLPTKQRLL